MIEPPATWLATMINLSPRERDVLVRLSRRLTTEEIAQDLYLSVNTIRTHVRNTMIKMGVNNRHDAVQCGYMLGLLGSHCQTCTCNERASNLSA